MSKHLNRDAMTLIELLVALSLSSMLIAVLFTLVAQLSNSQERLRDEHDLALWRQILKQQLVDDYRNCRSVLVRSRELILLGNYSKAGPNGQELSSEQRIRYFILSDTEGNWLYREQAGQSGTSGDTELVCSGVIGFRSTSDLSTDVAPGVLQLQVISEGTRSKQDLLVMEASLVRHGGVD
ncbi:MAG: prepilin-type N-terminal cleavage/methylation domain-containing protein [Planctomycetota bacterium]